MIYDSEVDTRLHIDRVRFLLSKCAINLLGRGLKHDASKLESPEKTAFDLAGDRHLAVTYGSEEYRASLAELEPALAHHYANNSHHPQHYPNGINGMSLFDLLEMLMDWKATAERKLFPNLAHPARGDRAIREPQKGTNATNATPAGTRRFRAPGGAPLRPSGRALSRSWSAVFTEGRQRLAVSCCHGTFTITGPGTEELVEAPSGSPPGTSAA